MAALVACIAARSHSLGCTQQATSAQALLMEYSEDGEFLHALWSLSRCCCCGENEDADVLAVDGPPATALRRACVSCSVRSCAWKRRRGQAESESAEIEGCTVTACANLPAAAMRERARTPFAGAGRRLRRR